MNEPFIGTPSVNEKIDLFGHSVQEIHVTDFNLLILMQIDNAYLQPVRVKTLGGLKDRNFNSKFKVLHVHTTWQPISSFFKVFF